MAEPMVIDDSAKKKPGKRKRASLLEQLTVEERESQIAAFRSEIVALLKYFREGLGDRVSCEGSLGNSAIACLLEESNLSLSKLVDKIHGEVKDREGFGAVTVASVKSSVLLIGQRTMYGVPNADADVLEDEREDALWCWETRDLKLMPKSMRGAIKNRRTCRKKIHERIVAVSEMIAALQKFVYTSYGPDIRKASEMLGKALSESDIRLLQQRMEQKNDTNKSEADTKKEQKLLMKQLGKSRREAEKEKKKMDRELEKEKKQNEKEQKRLQEEAEKEEKRREKEESELRKHLRRKEEEAEKDQRRREKEEAEKKRQFAMQKQASLMERFLKKCKTNSTSQDDQSPVSTNNAEPVTQLLDHALTQNKDINTADMLKSHLISWRSLGRQIRENGKPHWGIRKKPKMELVKGLKLSSSKELGNEELNVDKFDDGMHERRSDGRIRESKEDRSVSRGQTHCRHRQLLQFDKSYRPAFYGIWSKKSQIIGPRHPFKMDPDLDYEVDSDEEWEEEEPGESLSDCDKDDEEESLEEGKAKIDDEDESEDGFFVPDGYLSESEGVEVERKESSTVMEDTMNSPRLKQESESEEISLFFRQQKQLQSLTEHALRKNKPLIILNTMHEKAYLEVTPTERLERVCLQALSMRVFPGFPSIEISVCGDPPKDQEAYSSDSKEHAAPVATKKAIAESDLPQIVAVIQECSQSIGKIMASLQQNFPSYPKYLLRNKVREISEFVDNRWQVKQEILDKHGISISPEKRGARGKSITSFFSKRCLPPGNGKSSILTETSPQSSQEPPTTVYVSQQEPMVSIQPLP